jgi:hypothetical protein
VTYLMCLLKERKGKDIVSKCGRSKGLTIDQCTVWWTDVTCPQCLALMNPPKRVRLIPSA